MPPQAAPVLIDANAIIEAHRKGCWAALCGRFRVETVEQCFVETQTGFQKRRQEELIDPAALRAQLAAVHQVSKVELARVDLLGGPLLDEGEKALWAHAIARNDAWVLCGPDRASMRFGFELGFRDRLVSLGGMLNDIGHRPRVPLGAQYEKAWLDRLLNDLAMGLL
jgi:hypothetical protein